MDSDSEPSSSEEELREMLRNDQNKDEKNIGLLNKKSSLNKKNLDINYTTANIFSRIFFNWSKRAMEISNERVLKTSDVCALQKYQSTRYNIKNIQEIYNKYSEKNIKYPLMLSIFLVHKSLLLYLLFLDVSCMILDYLRMFFFSKILTLFSEQKFFISNRTLYDIFFLYKFNIIEATLIFIIIKFIRAIMLNHLDFNNIILGEKITNEMTSLIYEKILKGNTENNLANKGEGEKLNYIEADAEEIGSLFYLGPFVLTMPVKVGISVYFLFKLLGYRFIYAIIALIVLIILILLLQVIYVKNLKILLKYKDNRMKIVTFVFQMLKNIKLNGWDEEFIKRIKIKRDDELTYTKKNLNIEIIRFILNSNINLLLMIIALGLYVTSNDKLEISVLFTSFQLVNSMTFPIMLIPNFINQIFKDLISIQRLQNYLFTEDHQTRKKYENLEELNNNQILVKFEKMNFCIQDTTHEIGIEDKKNSEEAKSENDANIEMTNLKDKFYFSDSSISENDKEKNLEEIHEIKEENIDVNDNKININNINNINNSNEKINLVIKKQITLEPDYKINLLKDITFSIKKGEFIAIVGPTGSGKTSLLNAILNNYIPIYLNSNSKMILNGEISYVNQQPWVMTDTVKNNILFNNEFNEDRYNKVVSVCELENDFNELANGDKTEINSTNANVSGGQKARISLARCLYKEADLYLLDDPLSSVDSKVGNKIFLKAFIKFLKDKARILVTNELNNLSFVDKIVYMENKKIIFIGTYNEFNNTFGSKNMEIESNSDDNTKYDKNAIKVRRYLRRKSTIKRAENLENLEEINEEKNNEIHNINNNPLTQLNRLKRKNVSLETYITFIKLQGGVIIFFILIIFVILSQVIESYRRLFATSLTKTAKDFEKNDLNENIKTTSNDILNFDLKNKFIRYAEISILGILCNCLVEFIVTRTTIHSLRKVHEDMINVLVRAPINLFHDIVPIGQILNRLTKDTELIEGIIKTVNMAIKILFTMFANIGVCYLYNQYVLYASPFLFIACLIVTNYYISCQRNLVRLHRVSYSPILTIASESIRGVDTIRTFHAEEDFRNKIYKRLDDHYGVHLYIEGSKHWYNITLRIISNIFFALIISFMGYYSDYYSAQAMAIVLQGLEDLIESMLNGVKIYTTLEMTMIGLERCETVTKIQMERKPREDCTDKLKKEKWPKLGKINFVNYFTSYRPDTPDILKNINFEINPGDKVAIVGRTGSGKSSMVLALSRIIEAKKGKINIDDIDITNIELDFLRQSLSIVPQEPFIIEGNLRDNIDPLRQFSDKNVIKVLNDFALFKNMDNKEKLNLDIKEGGKNLSNGQKQLICFARALIKGNKIMILDEATSSLDIETEKIIEVNIQKYLKDVTMLVITHHIHNVKNYKKIVVVDQGRIVESGDYDSLLKNKSSHFYSLYEESKKQ